MTTDTLGRLSGMLDEDEVEHRLRYAPDIAALLDARPNDDLGARGVRADRERAVPARDDLRAGRAIGHRRRSRGHHRKHRRQLDQARRIHVCPPEVRARIPDLVAEGERLLPAVREWSLQAKAFFRDVEQADYAPHIPPNVRMSGFETVGYRALENVLVYLAGVIHEAWSEDDSSSIPEIDDVAAARYDELEGATDIDLAWSEVRRLRDRVAELERSNDLRENALEGIRMIVDISDDLLTEAAAERSGPPDEETQDQPWPSDPDASSSAPKQPHLRSVLNEL